MSQFDNAQTRNVAIFESFHDEMENAINMSRRVQQSCEGVSTALNVAHGLFGELKDAATFIYDMAQKCGISDEQLTLMKQNIDKVSMDLDESFQDVPGVIKDLTDFSESMAGWRNSALEASKRQDEAERKDMEELKSKLEVFEQKEAAWNDEKLKFADENDLLKKQLDEYEMKLRSNQSQYSSSIQALKNQLSDVNAKVLEIEAEKAQLSENCCQLRSTKDELSSKCDFLEKENKKFPDLSGLHNDVSAHLTQIYDSLKAAKSRYEAVKTLPKKV